MHYQSDKKFRNFCVSGYEPNWFAGIIVNHSLDLTYMFGSSRMRTIWVKRPSCRTFVIINKLYQLFPNPEQSSDWHLKTINSSYWIICVNAKR